MTVVSTEEDLEKGRVAYLWGSRAILVTSLFLAAVAIYVFTQVPLDTTMAYSRLSGAFRIPVLGLVVLPVFLAVAWLRGRGQDTKELPRAERFVIYIVYPVVLAGFIWAHLTLAAGFLAEGRQRASARRLTTQPRGS